MSQKISDSAGGTSYNTYDTKIPDLTQAADIIEAFKLYHYGVDSYTSTSGAPASSSIYNHLLTLQNNINSLLAKVSYSSTTPSNPITGNLWVKSTTNEMYVYSGSTWILVSASGSGSSDSFFLMGA
jgi:hypothetical protein